MTYGLISYSGHKLTLSQFWQNVKIGGSGFITGIEVSNDGTKVIRADVMGAYVNTPSSPVWRQLCLESVMPVGTVADNGPFEVTISKTDSNRIYMMYRGFLYKSINQGISFTKLTTFNAGNTIVLASSNGNRYGTGIGFAGRANGRFMAVDPNDPNTLYVCTPENGNFVTFDGGMTWQTITGISQSLAVNGAIMSSCVAIDPHATPVNGRSPNVYIASYGFQTYQCTNGGSSAPTFSATSGGPSTIAHLAFDADGTLYQIDYSSYATVGSPTGDLWIYNGSWTNIGNCGITDGPHSVSPDPVTAGRLCVSAQGSLVYISTNHGNSFTQLNGNIQIATDVPWLGLTPNSYMSNGDMAFDRSGNLWFAEGIGVWSCTPPSSGSFNWTSQTAGIEEHVCNFLLSSPSYSFPLEGGWDRPLFQIIDPNSYPTTQQPNNKRTITAGWASDYASSDPTKICTVVNWNQGGYSDDSGISTDGGATWTQFATKPNLYRMTVNAATPTSSAVLHFGSVPTNLITTSPGGGSASTATRQISYIGTLATTTAPTLTSSRVLHFGGSLPSSVAVGMALRDDTNPISLGLVSVVSINTPSTGDVTLDGPPNVTIPTGEVIAFRQSSVPADPNAFIVGVSSTSITMGTNAVNSGILSGETFEITAGLGGSIAMSTPLNMLKMPQNNEPYCWYTKDGGVTWANVIVGTSITGFDSNGAAIPESDNGNATGWGFAYYTNRHMVCADRVTANKFYMYNSRSSAAGGGLYVSTDSGDTWTKKASSPIAGDSGGQNGQLRSVLGNAGHLFMTGANPVYANNPLARSTDSGTTWTSLLNVSTVQAFGLGVAKSGGTYPTIFMAGDVSSSGDVAGIGGTGIWRCDNMPLTGSSTETWTKINDIYPNGWLDVISYLEGDASVYGRCYVGKGASGAAMGYLG